MRHILATVPTLTALAVVAALAKILTDLLAGVLP